MDPFEYYPWLRPVPLAHVNCSKGEEPIMTLDHNNYLLYRFELSWEIDRSVPAERGKYGLLYKSYGGWTVCIHRDRHTLMFKHGKPKRMRKAK